ncbi:hypothetical protein P152DRAFT_192930 [Eremomyces bilateralis CBS 781.70]|uniref:Uncharacterized protein n=1 Tax=Eremomyces bilateralis CBS 781.70 TaxID=1392243 RepID=A0A6G1GCN6_9PEZI|nr:uncharacterized protein P152DRAFT_192930 [Eremomyces bilateralis CBS 781.70]KAF1815676.1 hypothetical protein P152DRAFT_192930 [Eremomyces bilateralis CBS 781.70]
MSKLPRQDRLPLCPPTHLVGPSTPLSLPAARAKIEAYLALCATTPHLHPDAKPKHDHATAGAPMNGVDGHGELSAKSKEARKLAKKQRKDTQKKEKAAKARDAA